MPGRTRRCRGDAADSDSITGPPHPLTFSEVKFGEAHDARIVHHDVDAAEYSAFFRKVGNGPGVFAAVTSIARQRSRPPLVSARALDQSFKATRGTRVLRDDVRPFAGTDLAAALTPPPPRSRRPGDD